MTSDLKCPTCEGSNLEKTVVTSAIPLSVSGLVSEEEMLNQVYTDFLALTLKLWVGEIITKGIESDAIDFHTSTRKDVTKLYVLFKSGDKILASSSIQFPKTIYPDPSGYLSIFQKRIGLLFNRAWGCEV